MPFFTQALKKRGTVWAVLVLAVLIGGAYWLFPRPAHFTQYCAFCNAAVLESQKFYEDDLVLALYTHKPIFPGHCLVIPRRHVERFESLTDEEITQMGRVIKKIDRAVTKVFGTSSYLLLQKNGLEVGQSVPHVHVHYIPRRTGDDSSLGFFIKMFIANAKGPISTEEMQQATEKLKQEMQKS
jgi:histidine triad (HIT) family protein